MNKCLTWAEVQKCWDLFGPFQNSQQTFSEMRNLAFQTTRSFGWENETLLTELAWELENVKGSKRISFCIYCWYVFGLITYGCIPIRFRSLPETELPPIR